MDGLALLVKFAIIMNDWAGMRIRMSFDFVKVVRVLSERCALDSLNSLGLPSLGLNHPDEGAGSNHRAIPLGHEVLVRIS